MTHFQYTIFRISIQILHYPFDKVKNIKIAIVMFINFSDIFLVLNIHIYKILHFAYSKYYMLVLFENCWKIIHIFTFRVLIFNTDESRFETRMKFLRDLDCLNYFVYVSTKGKTLRAFMFRTRKPIIPFVSTLEDCIQQRSGRVDVYRETGRRCFELPRSLN